ncbi:MAG: sulfite exporter TauE/SafE family protein [Deltaproteobacteria bacterium]|nr:sulfite exporter TauE/SafE family protein [Deltaproteobacteria bacterium]
MPTDQTTVLVAASLLMAAYVKGITGLGFPLIATPMVVLLLDIRTAITILIIPNIVMDITQIFRGSFPTAIFRRLASLLLLAILGVFLGTKFLVILPLWILDLALGITVLAFVASNFLRIGFQVSPHVETILSPLVGVATGFIMGITNAGGPAIAIYLYGLGLPKTEFIKSIATIFIVSKVSQLVAVSTWNLFTPSTLRLSLLVTMVSLVGFYAGLKTQDRVNQKTFNRCLLILLFVIGLILVVRSLR